VNNNATDTYQKAFAFNMDKSPYGTIAEIGAGQETARWFFKVGGAAATIAKTMSAYDMKFSDLIYGECKRYVSRERLQAMLDKEYGLVIDRLNESRGDESTFYAFANTVSTYNYTKQCAGHGWLGIRFQTNPGEAASQIVLHVVLKGMSNSQDQEVLGILGVNLIYGAHYLHDDAVTLLTSLMDELNTDALDIDMIDFEGPAFETVDNRLMALHLVKQGMTQAAMFHSNGKLLQPSDALYKKAILVERSIFRPPTLLTMNILDCAYDAFIGDEDIEADKVLVLSEMTLQNLTDHDSNSADEDIDIEDFLHRVEILCALGKNVMISNFGEFYKLAQYLYRHTSMPVAVAMVIPNLCDIFHEQYYEDLDGGILEAFGRLFRHDMRLYVCPRIDGSTGAYLTADKLGVDKHLRHLYRHMIENDYIKSLDSIERDYVHIKAWKVLDMIRNDDELWKTMVPDKVVRIITERELFK